MQFRSTFLLFALIELPCGCLAALLRMGAQQEAISAATSAAWAAVAETEASDQRFWKAQWASLESMLLQLEEAGIIIPPSANHSKTSSAPAQHLSPSGGNHSVLSSSPAQHSTPLAGLKLNVDPKNTTDLLPALAMLKGLYEEDKESIAKLNAREKQSKELFEKMQAKHNAKIATIEARFKNGTIPADFHANETRDENRVWSYWQRVRERHHRQFHTSLKIQHGTMQKVKSMIDMYEETISGKADMAKVRKDLAKVAGGVPEVVFLQEAWKAAAPYFREALVEVRKQTLELGEAKLHT